MSWNEAIILTLCIAVILIGGVSLATHWVSKQIVRFFKWLWR